VLLMVFNRPDATQQVMSALREAKPAQLYVVADGPRVDHPRDEQLCARVRDVIENVDWECDVHSLYRDANRGCRDGVSDAVSWFFDRVEEGIILEDDCVPHPTFFRYCSTLLERYREDERVFAICGTNELGQHDNGFSYSYSLYGSIWGWASWRRAWQYYDVTMSYWPVVKAARALEAIIPTERDRKHYEAVFELTHTGAIDTWDYQWTFARLLQHGLSVMPNVNLVSNIGFGHGATHTHDGPFAALGVQAMTFPLSAPPVMVHDQRYRDLVYARLDSHDAVSPARRWWRRRPAAVKG
jgi:hypothetical protein